MLEFQILSKSNEFEFLFRWSSRHHSITLDVSLWLDARKLQRLLRFSKARILLHDRSLSPPPLLYDRFLVFSLPYTIASLFPIQSSLSHNGLSRYALSLFHLGNQGFSSWFCLFVFQFYCLILLSNFHFISII